VGQKRHRKTDAMLSSLREEKVTTWFDLGLLLDRLREDPPRFVRGAPADLPAFERDVAAGVGFLTFDFGIDGVSMEIAKYAEALRLFLGNPKIHYIAGHFEEFLDHVIVPTDTWHTIESMRGFDDWPSYRDFFSRKLERGGSRYNKLIGRLWSEVLSTCEGLGAIIEENDIRLLYLANTNSNPGNVGVALATVLVSEYLGIPVVNNCHDFYWESGASAVERAVEGTSRGSRDHFFTNAHVGEIFSVIERLYPWESRSWISACINTTQVDALSERFGHNPASVVEIGTAIDTERYTMLDRRRTKEAWNQVAEILSAGRAKLPAHAVGELLAEGRFTAEARRPMLIAGKKQANVDFVNANTVLLQATRIISRKRIELNFKLIEKLFGNSRFLKAFLDHPEKKLTLLISGPVAPGNDPYLERLIREFSKLVPRLPAAVRDRVYVAFLFSEFDHREFRARHPDPIGMPELYNIASLAVLPSKIEGRSLPLIESAACGVLILTCRYEPAEVFSAVIGENLAREDRLDVIVFEGTHFKDSTVEKLCDRLLSTERPEDIRRHNRRVVENRFSIEILTRDLGQILRNLHLQMQEPRRWMERASDAMKRFAERVAVESPKLDALLETRQREYLPGFGRMGFMLMLKSLIDPSYFRIEEQRLRGMAFDFAARLMRETARSRDLDIADCVDFYNTVDSLFLVRDGEMSIQVDHSLAYRHRNRRRYRYRELTPQELTGVIASVHRDAFGPLASIEVVGEASHPVADWSAMVERCFGGGVPEIDDRDFLYERLRENVPIAIFPGALIEHELEVFVLEALRRRLGLGIHDELPAKYVRRIDRLAPITIIERRERLPGGVSAESLEKYLVDRADPELKLLYEHGVCRVVASDQISVGIDFRQLGVEALEVLDGIRTAGGFIVALCPHAAMTTDAATLDRFHIGRATDPTTANILGIAPGASYVAWAPAGLRPTLAYPTPVQTAKSLSETLHTQRFAKLRKRLGDSKLRAALCEDAISRGSRVEDLLQRLATSKRSQRSKLGPVEAESLNGVYDDGCPWSGVIASIPPARRPLRYAILSSNRGNQTVPEFVRRFNQSRSRRAQIAWNGGYILNPELVGKLGLPESYIGSPLGLIISNGRLLSPPLFNKPAFLVGEDRSLSIRRVSCELGLTLRARRTIVELGPETRNLESPGTGPCFYDLFHDSPTLPGDGRSIVRLAGSRIVEIVDTKSGENPPVLPVGLVVSFPAGGVPSDWEVGRTLAIEVAGLEGIADAVEAGPLLLDEGQVAIDMEREGWKTRTSIESQAARIDYLDMRGPKIAIGLDDQGTLVVLALNGRIRESVGATHVDMAEILLERGMRSAMGFDPGGSATLVVGKEILNISPYNHDYERNVYSLPPEPRSVANVVVGY
jgi:glycosyltransferase involved in cell wall biosynthesis